MVDACCPPKVGSTRPCVKKGFTEKSPQVLLYQQVPEVGLQPHVCQTVPLDIYPDEKATYPLRAGMCVNSDISLFGHAVGSNRIEEGFVITADGPVSLTPYIRQLCENGAISTDELSDGVYA